jgi:extracellular factor (EF) 3-hydroxypalmitic acid methyl ester biosynthesis protein
MTAVNPVSQALDEFQTASEQGCAAAALLPLVADLSIKRVHAPHQLWRAWCADVFAHPAFEVLLQDPYSRNARHKPAGYAGDARTLDYVYLRDRGTRPVSEVGAALFDLTTGTRIADAVRHRCQCVADLVQRRLSLTALRVTSVACGHARELDLLPAEAFGGVRFWGIDQDPTSIQASSARLHGRQCVFEVGSVRAVLRGTLCLPVCDVAYASGLFDYLDDRASAVLLKRMLACVQPGGAVVVANLSPANEEIAYMEAVMDWWMHYRDMEALRQLAREARLDAAGHRIATYTTCDGRVAWLEIQRVE